MHGFIQEIMSTHGGKLAMSLRDQCCTQDLGSEQSKSGTSIIIYMVILWADGVFSFSLLLGWIKHITHVQKSKKSYKMSNPSIFKNDFEMTK